MVKLCNYTSGSPYTGIKYIPNNESRAVAVRMNLGVCLLEIRLENITAIGNCYSLGFTLS